MRGPWHLGLRLAALLGAVFLVACDGVAELIPGESTPTPIGSEATATPSRTPIVVNPADGSVGGATGGRVVDDLELALSIVQILAVDTSSGSEQVVRFGSGVVVDAENRLIATTYPVAAPYTSTGGRAYTSLIVAASSEPGAEPERAFIAEIAAADRDTGVAILRVVSNTAGEPVTESTFNLPAVAIGDTSTAAPGFDLRLFGYPGVPPSSTPTSQVVTTATAEITGQRGASELTGRMWFKTDARMPFGAAGGPAFDQFGALVGILAQDRYIPTGQVGQFRPLDLLLPLITAANGGAAYEETLFRTGTLPGSLMISPNSSVYVSRPGFAENAVESNEGRDLFDYETRFAEGLGGLYYEYEVNGVEDGATIEERWFLDGVQQESLSSSYVWSGGRFGLVTDRVTSANTAGIPRGRWRLDVYVTGTLQATNTAIIGVELGEPNATFVFGASLATQEGNISSGAFASANQLLMMFEVTGMEGARKIEWVVFRDNLPIHTSPEVIWQYGDTGRFWIGYRSDEPIGTGLWEFELHADGRIIGVGSLSLF